MKRHTLSIVLTLVLGLALSATEPATNPPESHRIENVPFHPMMEGFCAMTSLWMNLEYYGTAVEVATLLNLGWSHGLFYWKTPERTWIYPNTGPVEEIVHAAPLFGYEAREFKHDTIEAARRTIVDHVSRDIPVIVQWIGHTVLAVGYEKYGEVVIVHNPGEPRSAMVLDGSRPGWQDSRAYERHDTARWQTPPFSWGVFGYHCIVVRPTTRRIAIDWKAVWRRSADKTLGRIQDPYPALYGLKGLRVLIDDCRQASFDTDDERTVFLMNFEGLFFLGSGFRREAAAFLAGAAAITNDGALTEASRAFRDSTHLCRRGYNLLLKLREKQVDAALVHRAVLDLLEKFHDAEKRGAEALMRASASDRG